MIVEALRAIEAALAADDAEEAERLAGRLVEACAAADAPLDAATTAAAREALGRCMALAAAQRISLGHQLGDAAASRRAHAAYRR